MKVVLKHSGRWLEFTQPEKVLRADRIEEVLPAIEVAENSGLFAAGFISYEAASAFDSALKTQTAGDFPLLMLGLFKQPEVVDELPEAKGGDFSIGDLKPSVSKGEFQAAIDDIKDRIAEGATYQVNYTYRLSADFSGDTWAFFHELVKGQKTEHAAFIEADDFSICSASPELFFSLSNGTITSRPMKGTAKRGLTFSSDWKQAEGLRESEKDRAENIMIVDMIRNDIGRVAEAGSVKTISQFDVEKYPTVWQMTSTVQGKINHEDTKDTKGHKDQLPEPSSTSCLCGEKRVSYVDVLKALYPCASITGAPKAKTMEIIQGLETSPRKIYTGSIGFITPQREACFNVAIRTALIVKGRLEFGVGGGIVWDSDAEAEFEETLTKARVLTEPRPDFQLLETMLWEPENGIYLLDEHLQRLGKSAAYFDIPLDMHAVFQNLQQFGDERLRVRLLVSKDGNSEVQTFPIEGRAVSMKPPRTDSQSVPALRVAIAQEPVNTQDVFLFHKTTHRVVYEKTKADFPEYDEVILWNEKGEVTEGTFTNVVITKDGKKITPPVSCGLLGGTFREHLLKTGVVEEDVISVDDLKSADEVWLVNSVRKWQKAVLEV